MGACSSPSSLRRAPPAPLKALLGWEGGRELGVELPHVHSDDLPPFPPALPGTLCRDSSTGTTLEAAAEAWRTYRPNGKLRSGAGAAETPITSGLLTCLRNTDPPAHSAPMGAGRAPPTSPLQMGHSVPELDVRRTGSGHPEVPHECLPN